MNREEAIYSARIIRAMILPPGVCMDVTPWGGGERCGLTVSLRTLTGETDAVAVTGIVTRHHIDEIGRTAHAMLNLGSWMGGKNRPPVTTANGSDDGIEPDPDWVKETRRAVDSLVTPVAGVKADAFRLCRMLEHDGIPVPVVVAGSRGSVELYWTAGGRGVVFVVQGHGFVRVIVSTGAFDHDRVYDTASDPGWLDVARDAVRRVLDLDKASNKHAMYRLCYAAAARGES